LLGRFDFSWDGVNPPKMLEYNADTPSILLESGPVQADWFRAKYPGNSNVHQSNYIQPFLKDAMVNIGKKMLKSWIRPGLSR
jgi:glutathionylspermidine synthase